MITTTTIINSLDPSSYSSGPMFFRSGCRTKEPWVLTPNPTTLGPHTEPRALGRDVKPISLGS